MAQGIFPFDVVRVLSLHQHVSLGNGEGLFVDLLAEKLNIQARIDGGQ